MPRRRGYTRAGDHAAASMVIFDNEDFRPRWDAAALERAPQSVVTEYVLSTKAVQLLLGSEEYGGHVLPVSGSNVHALCKRGALDWISISTPGSRRPRRAFSRRGLETYFRHNRGGVEPPWHRLPPDRRHAMGLDF